MTVHTKLTLQEAMDVAVLGRRALVSGDVRTADRECLTSLGCGGLAAPAADGDPAGAA